MRKLYLIRLRGPKGFRLIKSEIIFVIEDGVFAKCCFNEYLGFIS